MKLKNNIVNNTKSSLITEELVQDLLVWIRGQVPTGHGAILGVSGGKDSTVALGLLEKAIGASRICAVMIPNGLQIDIQDSEKICNFLGIKPLCVNIGPLFGTFLKLPEEYGTTPFTEAAIINVAPRLRMTLLYALGQTMGFRVCGTGNASERTVGYCTKWGDVACDFNPLGNFTVAEVIEIGRIIGLPEDLLIKAPADGLSGKTDEDKLGISYQHIDAWVRNKAVPEESELKIKKLNSIAQHKLLPTPIFTPTNSKG